MLYLGPRGKTRLLEFPSLPFAITIIILFGFIYTTNAQEENIWAFGAYAGIDFNGGTARAIKTGIATREGSSSVCNANGQLLFYTDGFNVWDKNHNIMPRGKDLTQSIYSITASTTQGTIIIPMPGEQDQYYIFSLGEMVNSVANSPFLGKLYYSIVDMTLNGGLGDVARKGILLDSLLTEQMTAVSGNNCDAWLIVVSRTNNNFKSYNISINGVESQPVISKSAREMDL